jgi:hypothetical protein
MPNSSSCFCARGKPTFMGPGRTLIFRSRFWLVLGFLAVGVSLWLITWSTDVGKPARLSDGSQLSLRGLTIGQSCARYYGPLIGRISDSLPGQLRAWFPGGATLRFNYAQTNLVIWMYRDRVSATNGARLVFTLSDDRGTVVPLPTGPNFHRLPSGGHAVVLAIPIWPRASGAFVLSVYDDALETSTQLAAQWMLANPFPVERARWTIEELPVTQKLGDCHVTLEEFEVRPMPTMPITRVSRTNMSTSQAFVRFNVTGSDTSAPPWRLRAARLRDAAGNERDWRRNPNGQFMLSLPWPGEDAYQVESRWQSTAPAARSNLTELRNVPLTSLGVVTTKPFADGEVAIDVSKVAGLIPGWSLQAVALQSDSRAHSTRRNPNFAASLVEATDANGRSWTSRNGVIVVPQEVNEVSLLVDARPLTTVIFTARPTRSSSSLPAKRKEQE